MVHLERRNLANLEIAVLCFRLNCTWALRASLKAFSRLRSCITSCRNAGGVSRARAALRRYEAREYTSRGRSESAPPPRHSGHVGEVRNQETMQSVWNPCEQGSTCHWPVERLAVQMTQLSVGGAGF